MDNQETLQQNSELPKPSIDAATLPGEAAEYGSFQEQKTVQGGGQATAVSSSQAIAGLHAAAAGAVTTDATTIQPSKHTASLTAADADLIEKEWIAKAKEIVSKTHSDPYMQNKEINKMKADYIKKRYNKDIKQVSE